MQSGFTQIPNDILEAIVLCDLKKRELDVLLIFIRQSYGFHKDAIEFSADIVSRNSKIAPQHARTAIKSLINRKILLEVSGYSYTKGRRLKLNANVDEWHQNGASESANSSTKTVPVSSTKLVPEVAPKRCPYKYINQKKKERTSSPALIEEGGLSDDDNMTAEELMEERIRSDWEGFVIE